jgi:hypothetical protein
VVSLVCGGSLLEQVHQLGVERAILGLGNVFDEFVQFIGNAQSEFYHATILVL